jgi:tripartite-type tricarboxylate transporter receptor subunit TctC
MSHRLSVVTSFRRLSWLAIGAALAFPTLAFADESPAGFYKGKTFRVQVGSAAGSAYDLAARAVAKYIGAHIPGTPNVIVQNVPGAGSFTLANQIATIGPFDGTAIAAVINGVPTAALLRPEVTRFDPAQFNWIGSINRDSQILLAWHTAPVKTLEDLRTKELIVGGTTAGTSNVDFPLALNAVIGTKFKLVAGYETSRYVALAMERGEVQGNAGTGWSTTSMQSAKQLASGELKVLGQYGFKPHPDLPNVPLIFDLAKTEADKQALRLVLVRQEFGRSYFAPASVPVPRVQALRRAFDATVKDPGFLAEADKLKLEVEPSTGEELNDLMKLISITPPDVAARVRTALGPQDASN